MLSFARSVGRDFENADVHFPRYFASIIYDAEGEGILIVAVGSVFLAVAHLHRRPEYWRERLKGR